MRPAVALALCLLLAGCAQAPAPAAAPVKPAPALVSYGVPVSGYVFAKDAMVCPPPGTCSAGSDGLLLELKPNQTATGFRFVATVRGALGTGPAPPLHAEIGCTGSKLCSSPLAQADGAGTLVLAANVTLPPETVLVARASSKDPTPDPIGLLAPSIDLVGSVQVKGAPGPAPKLVAAPVHLTGSTGPCIVGVECNSGPGFSHYFGPFDGGVQRIELNLTWTAQTDLSRSLNLYIACSGAGCTSGMAHAVDGPSPLHLTVPAAGFPPGSEVYVSVSQTDPTGNHVGLIETRQDFRLDGQIAALEPPA